MSEAKSAHAGYLPHASLNHRQFFAVADIVIDSINDSKRRQARRFTLPRRVR
jgi:hypothetical protein